MVAVCSNVLRTAQKLKLLKALQQPSCRKNVKPKSAKMHAPRILTFLLPLVSCMPIGKDNNYHPVPHRLTDTWVVLLRPSPGSHFLTSLSCKSPCHRNPHDLA